MTSIIAAINAGFIASFSFFFSYSIKTGKNSLLLKNHKACVSTLETPSTDAKYINEFIFLLSIDIRYVNTALLHCLSNQIWDRNVVWFKPGLSLKKEVSLEVWCSREKEQVKISLRLIQGCVRVQEVPVPILRLQLVAMVSLRALKDAAHTRWCISYSSLTLWILYMLKSQVEPEQNRTWLKEKCRNILFLFLH